VSGLFPEIGFWKLPDGLFRPLTLVFDVASALALVAVVIALVRRAFFAPPHIGGLSRDASVILLMIGTLMVAFFGMNAARIAMARVDSPGLAPVSSFAANTFLMGVPAQQLEGLEQLLWWVHALVLLAFLNYLPYSKHMHILTAIPNCFFRSLKRVNTQPREVFEKDKSFGVRRVEQFGWKALFDSYSCTECGRCADVCPATSTGKALNPKLVIHDIKANLLVNAPLLSGNGHSGNGFAGNCKVLPLIGGMGEGSVSEDALWACTTCGACMQVCPVFIEHVPKIVEMRRGMVEMEARFPESLQTVFESVELRSNPWGIGPSERANWAKATSTTPFEAGKTEYLFYVGCAGAFDARSRKITLATAEILNAAGVSWGVLGNAEPCCGDSLRRLGNEYVFEQLACKNVEMFRDRGVRKIVTICPHCYSTLKNDYRQFGLEAEVVHHTELISGLIKQGRLKLKGTKELGRVVFHDSCYLGRHNDVFDAPRRAIASATGQTPVEMERQRERAFCCGAGGGRMWMEEDSGKRINAARAEEAMGANPDTICVSCPYCMTMFEDALKDGFPGEKVRVLDVAEVVTRAMA